MTLGTVDWTYLAYCAKVVALVAVWPVAIGALLAYLVRGQRLIMAVAAISVFTAFAHWYFLRLWPGLNETAGHHAWVANRLRWSGAIVAIACGYAAILHSLLHRYWKRRTGGFDVIRR